MAFPADVERPRPGFGRRNCQRPPIRAAAQGKRIVALGGGTGLPAVLRGLVDIAHPSVNLDALTAVVTVTDDGGSSGRLREMFGVLPPGDIRNCLVALSGNDGAIAQFLQQRISEDAEYESGHPVGNLLLTALTQVTGDFAKAIDQVGSLVGARGRVIPTTLENVRLRARMESGDVLIGETAIVQDPLRIARLSLSPSARPVPDVVRALVNADAIIVGPGSLYTSVLPNLLVEGVAGTIYGASAVRIYVANLMTEPGETDGYSIDDHLQAIREHAGYDLFDYILVHGGSLDAETLQQYAEQGSTPVGRVGCLRHAGPAQVVECDLAAHDRHGKIRHDGPALARAIVNLIDVRPLRG
jgi:uncharacterized cofD-like protein